MLVPVKHDLFDDFIGLDPFDLPMFPSFKNFEDIDRKIYGKNAAHIMKTDIHEHEDKFELHIDLPGFNKDQIKISLDKGDLIINAEKTTNNEQKDAKGKIIRQERYCGSMTRSFHIGDDITETDITAKFENGVLSIEIPKKDPQLENKTKYIAIS